MGYSDEERLRSPFNEKAFTTGLPFTLSSTSENTRSLTVLKNTLFSHDQGVELRARWRRVKADKKHGSLPPSLLHAYLCIILALIDAETCPKFCRMNRVKVVGACGLLALGVHFKTGDRWIFCERGKRVLLRGTPRFLYSFPFREA